MLTKLLFPPQWIPTQPYLSLPSLTAFLKANNCNVEQMDLNVTFYDDILSKKGLIPFHERVCSKFYELESRKELPSELQKKYALLGSSILFGEYTIEKVEDAKKILRDKNKFYEFDEFNYAFRILELGLLLASSAYYPTNLTFHAYDMRRSCRSSQEVLSAINDREENLFIEYFEKNTLQKLLENDPELIGISIINTSQIIPGLTLASLIKKADDSIHINIGGSVFTRLINEISGNKELFSVFDSVIVHEGESSLLALIKYRKGEFDIRNIPNLIYKDGAEIRVNKISSEGEDINSLPTPCFDGFPLELYFSPELVLPVLSSRGCYWRRCTFCDHGYSYAGRYRPRDVELLYNDLDTLKSRYKTQFFTFQDEGVAPRLIGELSDRLIENELDIVWLADSRFEPSFSPELGRKLANAGCKMLYFGLESANDRILGCMDKGIKKENVLRICRYCAEANIWTHIFLIFGFPTETKEEAKETMDFILAHSNVVRSLSFGSFQLTKHSKVHQMPLMFGILNIVDENMDISLWFDYETSHGMSKKDIDNVIKEFYDALSRRYRDMKLWSNLDREHLFLYISHYGSKSGLSLPIKMAREKQSRQRLGSIENDSYPMLREGVFAGAFNFNLARINRDLMSGNVSHSLDKERTNVLFDTNSNRIFTVPDFAKDILDSCNGKSDLSEIVDIIQGKYRLSRSEAEFKCKDFLNGLVEKNILAI